MAYRIFPAGMAQIISREGKLRLREVSNKLRTASATLNMERQLGAIDIHDTDPNGNPSKAFGRVFLIEGKFLTFFAFDLNEDTVLSAKRSFQVWAVPGTGKNSARSLGGGPQATQRTEDGLRPLERSQSS